MVARKLNVIDRVSAGVPGTRHNCYKPQLTARFGGPRRLGQTRQLEVLDFADRIHTTATLNELSYRLSDFPAYIPVEMTTNAIGRICGKSYSL